MNVIDQLNVLNVLLLFDVMRAGISFTKFSFFLIVDFNEKINK